MGHKLLLADDSITIQKVVGIIFAGDQYEVTVTDNGVTALERARESVPDIMLVDALMPEKNGYDVCREVRQDPLLSTVPLLLLTGVFEPFDEARAKECGADDFIAKPFESQAIMDKVKSLIDMGAWRRTASPVAPPAAPPEPEPVAIAAPPVPEADLVVASPMVETFSPVFEPAPVETFSPVFETTPVETFAPAVEPTPVETFSPVFEPNPVETFSQAFEPTPPPVVEPPAVEPPAPEEEIIELIQVAAEDDLWGFEPVEETVAEAIPYGIVIEEPQGSVAEVEELEPLTPAEPAPLPDYDFSAVPERSDAVGVVGDVPEMPSAFVPGGTVEPEPEPVVAPADELEFSFEDEPAAPALLEEEPPCTVEAVETTVTLEVEEPFGFEEPVIDVPSPAGEEPLPVSGTAEESPDDVIPRMVVGLVPPEEPASAVEAMPSAVPALTEEQLVAALSKVSREVIERIVWEVVPDLAEALIKEEIRKIREAV